MLFTTVEQVKAAFALLDPAVASIKPHYSAQYIWAVRHPSLNTRGDYGFSSKESLLTWANANLTPHAPANAGNDQ
jgi:hypothetical protein